MPRLWPEGVVLRHIHFLNALSQNRDAMFEAYEKMGGEYYGPSDSSEDENANVADQTTEQSSDSDDDTDAVFKKSFCVTA